MTTSDIDLRMRVLLSVQRALVGEITQEMRFIAVEFSPERIHVTVWHDGKIDDSISAVGGEFDACAISQIVADFLSPERDIPEVSFEFTRCDFPLRPDFRGTLVYGRSET
jgi:hypothetical protein